MASIEEKDNKTRMTKREGKRVVFEAGFTCNIVATICLFISFVSGYWIVSWPRVYSPFKRIGLWEACFAGLVLFPDPTQKAYHGCWWILAPEYTPIRDWIMPGWFIYTQVATTLVIVAEVIGILIHFAMLFTSGGFDERLNNPNEERKTQSIYLLQTGMVITVVTASLMGATCAIFAICWYFDRNWLPYPEFNYLSWSYGLAVVSSFFQIFASIAQVTYVMVMRQEMRQPPTSVALEAMGGYRAKLRMDDSKV